MGKRMLPLMLLLPMINGCSGGVVNLGKDMAMNLLWAVPFVVAVIGLIFLMNHYITKDGRTHDRACSLIGAVLFPMLFVAFIGFKFGFTLWPMVIAVVLGIPIGWFSYTIDELMEDAWGNKAVVIPAALGLIMAGYMTTALFTHVWLEGAMYITHKA